MRLRAKAVRVMFGTTLALPFSSTPLPPSIHHHHPPPPPSQPPPPPLPAPPFLLIPKPHHHSRPPRDFISASAFDYDLHALTGGDDRGLS